MPNAPDLLAPKAAELIAWLEREIVQRWQGHEGVFISEVVFDEDGKPSQGPFRPATAADMPEHVRQLRAVITLLRERDEMAAVLVECAAQEDPWQMIAREVTKAARDAIAKLHTTDG